MNLCKYSPAFASLIFFRHTTRGREKEALIDAAVFSRGGKGGGIRRGKYGREKKGLLKPQKCSFSSFPPFSVPSWAEKAGSEKRGERGGQSDEYTLQMIS